MTFIKQMFTDKDGVWDDGRVMAFILMLAFVWNAVYALHIGQEWSPQEYGIGAGALVAGLGALLKLRGDN